ncbi:uncharacterized protein LOC141673362 [Apium graveolens]|uniref:uncharacterized protein LOC141673362 n=1 Tax=Apium graveolens TaxID=4045 RepID=UPI003D7ABE28
MGLQITKNVEEDMVKQKARLVAKGYVQKKGVNFEEVFARVTRLETVCLLLAIEVSQGKEFIELKQTSYAKKLLERCAMDECKPSKYPMEPTLQLHRDLNGKPVDSTKFKSVVGDLRYLKQRCVALSSCEAEFMAAMVGACQGIWLQNLFGNITKEKVGPVVLYIDNKSVIDLAKNHVFHGRSKHIDIRYYFIREWVQRGEIKVEHIGTGDQRADVLTKAMATVKFERLQALLGMKNL